MNLPDRKTVIIGLLSYTAWGLFPIYWRFIDDLQPGELLAHRFVWSLFFYLAVFGWFKWRAWNHRVNSDQSGRAISKPVHHRPTGRDWMLSAVSALVLGSNWLLFIYAVNNGHTLDASLAYFLNPILNVGVGWLFFREPIPWPMVVAITLAALGIGTQMIGQGEFPWIALTLATTFCAYGVTKKVQRVESNFGLVMESSVVFVPALIAAFILRGQSPVEQLTLRHWLLLAGTGIVTGVPLVLFSYAAQRVPYSLLGVMQFVAPTLQFLVGWLMFGEQLNGSRLIAFMLVWAGVGFYLADRLVRLARSLQIDERIQIAQADLSAANPRTKLPENSLPATTNEAETIESCS